ncbi:hypothetical protein F4778DRAFT_760504 [Xylariomycetidae sp. FL2044]|nr:hypothetical protein F4778DRAFT_760504 [Xylariomycetidae sp. FL2044]
MPPKKRSQAEAFTPERNVRRRSGRVSSSAGKRSTYFEGTDEDDDDPDSHTVKKKHQKKDARKRQTKVETSDDELAYEEESSAANDIVSQNEDDYEEEEEEEELPPPQKKRGRGRPSKTQASATTKVVTPKGTGRGRPRNQAQTATKVKAKSEEPHMDDEDEDEDEDEDGEPMVTRIKLPKLRDTDGIEYEDTRLHKNTLLFLKDLKANNKRNWLKMHDPEYRRSLKDWESFVETLTDKIIEADSTIPELPLKDVIFRIYRDIRFSKDPTPYKPHYSAAWSRTGRKGPYACYYVHLEPGHCFVGGGLWHPDNEALAKLRASIDERPHRIRRVLADPVFRRTFLPKAKNGDKKSVLKAFADANKENALKTKPKGFHPDHRDIQLLKLRNYTVGTKLRDEDVIGDGAQEKIMEVVGAMVQFVTFLNSVVMPDPGDDSDSDEEANGEGDDDEEVEEDEEADNGTGEQESDSGEEE